MKRRSEWLKYCVNTSKIQLLGHVGGLYRDAIGKKWEKYRTIGMLKAIVLLSLFLNDLLCKYKINNKMKRNEKNKKKKQIQATKYSKKWIK